MTIKGEKQHKALIMSSLDKMTKNNKYRRDFIIEIFTLFMSIKGRINFIPIVNLVEPYFPGSTGLALRTLLVCLSVLTPYQLSVFLGIGPLLLLFFGIEKVGSSRKTFSSL